MPWQVPITVDGLEYPVTFNTEGEPSQQDYDDAVQQILSQKAQSAPAAEQETPGYLSQLGSALGLGYRQMKSGVGATFNALTGDMPDVAAEMAEMSKLQREQQAAQTPEDVEFMRSLEEAEQGFEKASGPLESIGALAQYPAAVLSQPGAAFKTAVQSAPNALISGATSLAGYGLGGLAGGAANIETGPGAILTGIAGAMAGGALSNTLMEAGPAIFDVLNERTQGAASNMTADEISAYLQQNPDIVEEGMKTGAIRGSVIGAVESLGVKGSGRLLTIPERAAARAVQKELVAAGVDVASKEAVDQALLDPALRATTKAAAEAAKGQFSSAGNMARLAGASAIDTGAAGAGELAAQAVAGQEISTKEAFMEMLGDTALSLPMSVATKAVEGAQYMLNPALIADVGKVSVQNLADTGNGASAAAQDEFNKTVAEILQTPEPTVQPEQAAETPTPEVNLNEPTVPEEPELQPENIPNLEGDPFAEAKGPVSEEVIQPTPQALNAPDQITDQESLRQELQDRTGGRETEETGVSDSLRSQEEVEEEVITPKGTPTLATEGTPTSRDVGTERDSTKPEQMTPEEYHVYNSEGIIADYESGGKAPRGFASYEVIRPMSEDEKQDLRSDRAFSARNHRSSLERAIETKDSVSAASVDTYGITLPEGYVKQGDLYVFQPGATGATPVQAAPSAAQVVKATAPGPVFQIKRSRDFLTSGNYDVTTPDGVKRIFRDPETGAWMDADEKAPVYSPLPFKLLGYSKKEALDSLRKEYQTTTVATNETAPPSAKGEAVASAVEQPVEGSIPTVPTRETPKTDLSTPESKAADQEEQDAQKRQKKQNESIRKSLDSIIDKRNTNIVQGTVTAADAEAARTELNNSGEIPNAFLTRIYDSPEAFLADKTNSILFPESYARLQKGEDIEGLFENGQTLVFASNIYVSDLDRNIGEALGITPEQAAARRVITHENGHKSVALFTIAEKREFIRYCRQMYSDQQIADLVKTYSDYADWQTNPESRDNALEELFMKDFEGLKKIPTGGIWDEVIRFLQRVWQRLTGRKDKPTLKNMKDVVRLMRNATKRDVVPVGSYTLKDGGRVKLSAIAPTARITPEMDAEYLAAVEAGDMEKAQRMVDEAAREKGVRIVKSNGSVNPDNLKPVNRIDKGREQHVANMAREFVRSGKWNGRPILIIGNEALTGSHRIFAARRANEILRRLGRDEIEIPTFELSNEQARNFNDWIQEDGAGETNARSYDSFNDTVGDDADKAKTAKAAFKDKAIPLEFYALLEAEELSNWGNGFDKFKGQIYASESQIKSADPVTRDDQGNVIPLSQRFQPTSSDIRFSRPTFASPTDAAISAGSEAARSTIYNERDMDVREAIRRAYEAMPKDTGVAVPIGELFGKTEEMLPGVTQEEFSNVLQDLYEDNGAVLQEGASDFIVTTPEGRRAGFVVVMPRAAKASKIPVDDVEEASKTFKADLEEAGKGRIDTAAFEGRELKDTDVPEHNVKAYELYRDGAIKLIDDLMSKTNDIVAVAESLQDPNFQIAIGLQVGENVSSDMITIARQLIGAELDNRLANEIKKERSPSRKRQLELTKRKGISYYKAATGSGQALQNIQQIQKDPRYKWRFLFDEAEDKKAEVAKGRLDSLTGGTDQITDMVNDSTGAASIEATQQLEEEDASTAEDDQDAIDLAAGEETLNEENKSLWNKVKDWLREIGAAMNHIKSMGGSSKASLSAAQRSEISKMSREEALAFIEDRQKKINKALKTLLGEESDAKTPEQKKTRKKREKMVATAKKRAEQGKNIEAFLEGPNARQNLLREMNKARPASQVPLERAMPWKDILSQKSQNVEEYRQRIFDAISSLPAMENITEDQKQRLAELYAEAFEEKREEILKRILEREEARLFNSNAITKKAAKALQESRNKIIELVNLGGFNNDDLVKILGERFGISTSLTDEQKAKITELAEKLQDEDMNPAKRNKLAMEFVVELAGATDSSAAEILSNVWTSSVLFGPQTVFSIGAAFVNGGYSIVTVGMSRAIAKIAQGDFVGAIDESILILKGIARYLGAFKQAGRRSWNYLWSGEIEQLDASANDILGQIKSFDDLQNLKKHRLLAENLAKDPRKLRRYIGKYLRFINRLLASLDAFNVMVTKAGTTSLALRMSGLDTNKIIEAEKMLNLDSYKQAIIDKEFGGVAPTSSLEKGRLDSYAQAAMYKALDKFGAKMENADYLASESAMTMNPTGFGGFIYKKITGIDKEARRSADEYLEKVKKNWISQKDLDSFRDLSLAYIRQFLVYQAANVAGYKFLRYASNKFNQGISYIPLIGLARKFEARGDEIKGKDAFIETIHRNQMITFMMALVAASVIKAIKDEPDDEKRGWLWNGGWENLNPDQKKQRLALGQKEYTLGFKYNGRWYYFNYLNWPINQPMSAIGSISDQMRFSQQQWNEKSALSKITSGMVAGLKSNLDIPALSQLGEIFGSRISSKDPTEQTLNRTSRILSGWVGGFVPRILKDIDFYTQPELRKYEGLWEKTASHIPIYRRYVGDEYYDILGHPIKRNVIPGSREFMAGATEPEYKILGALNARNIWLTPANAEYRMIGKGRNRRRLTQEEADAYSLESGKAYRQMLLRYGQRALQMPTERARAFLLDKADEARDRALKKAVR